MSTQYLYQKSFVFLILFLIFSSCTNQTYSDLVETNTSLNLKFNAYQTGTIQNARIGLDWALSQIGAKNTSSSFNGIVLNNNTFTINYENLGFNLNAKNQLEKLHQKIKDSQEYKTNNHIDLGRYVTLIIGVSKHYYKINNVPENINAVLENYTLKTEKGYINNSFVSNKHRIIEFSEQNGLNQFFLATEIEPSTQEILEFETIEIMDNGHLKFGVYDINGNRKNNGKPSITNAGKPGKCMWCHESQIARSFNLQNDTTGFLTFKQLQTILINNNDSLIEQQLNLTNGVDFSNRFEHRNMELLYISFMEPSVQVLSKEWNLTTTQIQNILQNIETHQHEEFTFLGNLYHRNEIEQFAPFVSLQVSTHVREASEIEVDYIN